MERLAAKPTVGVPQACRGWGETIAAYRFFDNEEVEWATILEPHWQQTQQRMAAHSELTSRVVYEQFDGDRFQAASFC